MSGLFELDTLVRRLQTYGSAGVRTPKGAVSLRFPMDALEVLFPQLFAEA